MRWRTFFLLIPLAIAAGIGMAEIQLRYGEEIRELVTGMTE